MTKVRIQFNQTDDHIAEYAGLTASDLAQAVDDLRSGRIIGAIFREAIHEETRKFAVSRLETLGRIGQSAFEAQFSPFHWADYFRNTRRWQGLSRSVFSNGKYPVDLVRVTVGNVQKKGWAPLRLEEGIAIAGLMRFIDEGVGLMPHNDCIAADLSGSQMTAQIDAQLALNVMLQLPEAGGEAWICPRFFSRAEYDANRLPEPDHYAVRANALPAPVTIRAEEGDAYLSNAAHIHEVMGCTGDKARSTLSRFVDLADISRRIRSAVKRAGVEIGSALAQVIANAGTSLQQSGKLAT